MARSLSYINAVKLLRDPAESVVAALDIFTTVVMLAAAPAVSEVLSWLDARAEFARLSKQLAERLPDRMRGIAQYELTSRLEAAFGVLAVAAYFAVLSEHDLPTDHRNFRISRTGQLSVATGRGATGHRPADVLHAILDSRLPIPTVPWSGERSRTEVRRYFLSLSEALRSFYEGIDAWASVSHRDRDRLDEILAIVPGAAVERFYGYLVRFAADNPEVKVWLSFEGQAAALEDLAELRPDMSVLARAYRSALDQPVYDRRGLPDGLSLPKLGDAYRDPAYFWESASEGPLDRYLRAGSNDESTSERLTGHLTAYVRSTAAALAPVLVLGQPGAGKSLLSKVLAAHLTTIPGCAAVRIPLREVDAEAHVQDQIEQAVRAATGEAVSWPQFLRSTGGAFPVLIFDGLDELMSVTGLQQSDYLHQVQEFQEREERLGRPAAAIVTARTSVSYRVGIPEGTEVVRIEPFSTAQVVDWLEIWNRANARYFATAGLEPLRVDVALRQAELACQPLLLLMLALYDAPANALTRSSRKIGRAELYERLMVSFAEREVRRTSPRISAEGLAERVELELARLSIAALGMVNRGRQSITEAELDSDLTALGLAETCGGITPADRTVSGFFFVSENKAITGQREDRAFEFLHATFGEFLGARMIADEVRRIEGAGSDAMLHALLSSGLVLAEQRTLLELVESRIGTLPPLTGEAIASCFVAALDERSAPTLGGYQPSALDLPTRCATYSVNLMTLLLLGEPGPLSIRRLWPDSLDPFAQWRRHSSLWYSTFDLDRWTAITLLVRGRRRPRPRPDVLIDRNDDSPLSLAESTGLHIYQNGDIVTDGRSGTRSAADVVISPMIPAALLLQTASILLNPTLDGLLDGLAPYLDRVEMLDVSPLYDSGQTQIRHDIAELIAGWPLAERKHRRSITPPPPPATGPKTP